MDRRGLKWMEIKIHALDTFCRPFDPVAYVTRTKKNMLEFVQFVIVIVNPF